MLQMYYSVVSFLFMRILALDANFRLSNIGRSATKDDGLTTGLAYFCELEKYLEYVKQYPKQKDVRCFTCFSQMVLTCL